MAVAMWIRNNMLSTSNHIERQLTDAELKVQRSLQKLSIPDWYLNKRSAPPKILTNVAPIESRPSPWKSIKSKKMIDGDPKFFARYPSGTYRISGRVGNSNSPKLNSDTYKMPRRNETFSNDEEKSNSSSINDQTFDIQTRRKYVSKTFPKVSPSRKVQNINIVFPPTAATKPELSGDEKQTETSLNEAICRSDRETDCSTGTESDSRKESCESEDEEPRECYKTPKKTTEVKDLGDSFSKDNYRTPLKTPDPRYKFKVRAMSTPQGSPASLFSSTMIEEDTDPKKRLPLWYVRARNLFEAPASTRDTQVIPRKLQIPAVRQVSQEVTTKASPRKVVRRSSLERVSSATRRFFSARNKSTELENIVKSTDESRAGKRLVREIIRALSEKCEANTSTSSVATSVQSCPKSAQSYVKKLVRALENGRKSEAQEIIEERRKAEKQQEYEESEGSDTDAKSAAYSTSISISDTESGSDSDQRSPDLPNTKERFSYDDVLEEKSKKDEQVHWIPVPRCKMPRTSSLLSMMSRLSTSSSQRSPCVSPIKCSNDCTQTVHAGAWGSTYKKSSTPFNQLFRIDETVVTDSGYSEKSDRSSSAGSSITDVSWSTQTTGYRYVPVGVSRKIVY